MRIMMILLFSIVTLKGYSQVEPLSIKNVNSSAKLPTGQVGSKNDTIPTLIDESTIDSDHKPAYFINGRFSLESILKTIGSHAIDNINVIKEEIEVEGIKYYGQIYIQLKKDYCPKLISLTDLKSKYVTQSHRPTIFMIDNDIIKGDYNKCIVDEKYILNIYVVKIENIDENLNADIIRLLTRTDENIRKSKEIKIRGTDPI